MEPETIASPAPAAVGPEGRGAERFTLLVRAAKLVVDGREYLCVLRDASATGIKVKLFHAIPPFQTLELEVGSGERYPMDLMWHHEDQAGFRFHHEIDVNHLIDDNRARFPKRQIRLRIDHLATIHAHGTVNDVILRDISQQGACIESSQRLLLRQPVRIELAGFPPIYAKVCWRHQPRHGLVFEKGFLLEELARNLMKLHEAAGPFHAGVHLATG